MPFSCNFCINKLFICSKKYFYYHLTVAYFLDKSMYIAASFLLFRYFFTLYTMYIKILNRTRAAPNDLNYLSDFAKDRQKDRRKIVPYPWSSSIRTKDRYKRFASTERSLVEGLISTLFDDLKNNFERIVPKSLAQKGESRRSVQKWTVLSQTVRSFEPEWTAQDDSGRSFEPKWAVKGNEDGHSTKSGRYFCWIEADGPKVSIWTVRKC